MQKLSEGAAIQTGEFHYAGFWIRLASALIDGLIMAVLQFTLLLGVAGVSFAQLAGIEQPENVGFMLGAQLMSMVIAIGYEVVFIGRFSATLGKMACGIKIVTPEGGQITYLRAFGRYFAKILSAFTLYIGYIIAGFDSEKRALHDRICNTRVVYR
jgi:uncharacterized RDD family membrane protein YckC